MRAARGIGVLMQLLDFREGPKWRIVRELSEEDYTDYRSAVHHLIAFRNWRRLIDMVRENRREFDDAVTLADQTVSASPTLGVARDAIDFDLNRRLLNFLTAMRFFLDHTETRLKRRYGKESAVVEVFKTSISASYDEVFAYRFLYHLRNVAQHCSIPIGHIKTESHALPAGGSQRSVTFGFDTPQLLEAGGWKQPVKSELEAAPTLLVVPPLIDDALEELAKIHTGVEDAERALLEPSADKIVALGQPIVEAGGRPVVGLRKGDQVTIVRPPHDILAWLNRPVPSVDM